VFTEWRHRIRFRYDLERLNERELADMGITRTDAFSETQKPLLGAVGSQDRSYVIGRYARIWAFKLPVHDAHRRSHSAVVISLRESGRHEWPSASTILSSPISTSPARSQLPLRQLTFLTLAERTAPRDGKPS
jgi:hypothetical protein